MKHLFISTLAAVAAWTCITASASAWENIWEYNITHDLENHICIDFKEVEVLLPESWSGKCQMTTSSDSVSFFHAASRQRFTEDLGYEAGGWFFTLKISEFGDESYLEEPNYKEIGNGLEGFYYLSLPTDVQAYLDDPNTFQEYEDMSTSVDWILDNIKIRSDLDASYNEEESLIANSSSKYLSEDDLCGYSADYLQMAINEIYARHHRKFVLDNVREYFESTSWYEGYIEPDDFDPSVMNEYEDANIALMLKVMNQLNAETDSPYESGDVYESSDPPEENDDTPEEFYYQDDEVAAG